ncbi:MAG: hypothetical protein HZB38_07000 [Planctomycetes bacterium]|nr:hypothetical protein [Planctomycetota bacterium]
MTSRMANWKKALIRIGLGGSLMFWAWGGSGWGWGSCVSNAALTNFYTNVGTAVIDSTADSAAAVGGDFNTFVVQPTAGFFRNLWTTFVDLNIPTDPTFDRLLAE